MCCVDRLKPHPKAAGPWAWADFRFKRKADYGFRQNDRLEEAHKRKSPALVLRFHVPLDSIQVKWTETTRSRQKSKELQGAISPIH